MDWREYEGDDDRFIVKQIRVHLFQEEIDWVAEYLLRPRILTDAIRKKTIDRMLAAFLRNPKTNGTWVIDKATEKHYRLIYDVEGHYIVEPDRYLIYPGRLFDFAR